MAKAHSPIRLDAALMAVAEATAKRQHRSTAEQIEYWAEIGRLIEPKLDGDALEALRVHVAEIEVKRPAMPTADYVWAELAARFEPGAEPDPIVGSGVRYQIARDAPGYLERIDDEGIHDEGNVEVGTFRNGEFVPR